MQRTGTIQFLFDTARAPETVEFALDESELPLLRSYLAEAQALEELMVGFGRRRIGFSMSARQGEPVSTTAREPGVVQRAAMLHHLRPFVLDEEPFSFFKLRNVVARSSESAFLRERLKELKQMFSGQRLQEQMTVRAGDMLVNSEATLRRWLNAFEYHRDRDKAQALEKALGPLPANISRPIFFMLLHQKADAILYLGQIVSKMLNTERVTGAQDV